MRETETVPAERLPFELPAPEPGRRRPSKAVGIAVAAAAALLAVALFVVSRGRTEEKKGGGETTAGAETPAPRPVVETGVLVVDVLPWGRVERIEDGSGKDWLVEGQSYTPLAVSVPAGRYSILVTSANFPGRRLTLAAQVKSGERAACQGRFEIMEAQTYFEAEGWR